MIDAHGGNVYAYKNVEIDFSVNLNPFGMPEEIKKAVRDNVEHYEQYPDTKCRALRKVVSDQVHVPEDRLVFGNGAADLIIRLCSALKPRKALVAAPTFSEYEAAVRQAGGEVDYFYLKEEEGFRLTAEYAGCVTDDVDMVFLCNPNNPTGSLAGEGTIRAFAQCCREVGAWLVIDECFLDFTRGQSAKELLPEYPNLMILRAFTKMFSMAGLRLGYMMCAEAEVAEKIESMGQSWSVSTPAQVAGIAAMSIPDYPARTRAFVEQERQWLLGEFARLPVKTYPSDGVFLLFRARENLWDKAMEKGIMIRSCANYVGLDGRYYRIGIKLREKNQRLLAVLGEILR